MVLLFRALEVEEAVKMVVAELSDHSVSGHSATSCWCVLCMGLLDRYHQLLAQLLYSAPILQYSTNSNLVQIQI